MGKEHASVEEDRRWKRLPGVREVRRWRLERRLWRDELYWLETGDVALEEGLELKVRIQTAVNRATGEAERLGVVKMSDTFRLHDKDLSDGEGVGLLARGRMDDVVYGVVNRIPEEERNPIERVVARRNEENRMSYFPANLVSEMFNEWLIYGRIKGRKELVMEILGIVEVTELMALGEVEFWECFVETVDSLTDFMSSIEQIDWDDWYCLSEPGSMSLDELLGEGWGDEEGGVGERGFVENKSS